MSEKRANANLFLRMDCIDWLLAYAADELHFQGVQPASPEPVEELVANCPAVADLRLEWDFDAKAWEACFVGGPYLGKTQRMTVDELDKDMWRKLKDMGKARGFLTQASMIQKKSAVKELLTLWGAMILWRAGD